jgi:diaminopimelate epimerase
MNVPFWKLQAIGNDFPLFHISDLADVDLSALAIRAADRKFGIGGDGILTLERVDRSRVKMRMFNPDGTEDFCGNGLRIAARHAFDQSWVDREFVIVHGGADVFAEVGSDGQILTTLGSSDYSPSAVPHTDSGELFDAQIGVAGDREFRGSALTTGSTHTVIPVAELPSDQEIERWGPELEHLPLFPDRTSVIFVREVAEYDLKIRIWERGVGETLGCGTGSSAAAADYLRRRGSGGTVLVRNPGGNIQISMDRWNAPITVQGEATEVYRGQFPVD